MALDCPGVEINVGGAGNYAMKVFAKIHRIKEKQISKVLFRMESAYNACACIRLNIVCCVMH
jgi:hypothetical protein